MAEPRTISLDAMGGDFGPEVVVAGAALSLSRHPGLRFMLFGDEHRIQPLLGRHPELAASSRVVHTDVAVAMNEKPSQALRTGRRTSSMWMALEAVKMHEAHVAVSAGNTGALMAMAKLCLRTMPGIERPALAALWPTIKSSCIVLDVGANVGASARQLGDFALMGAAMARALFQVDRPTVGLLNIGVEEIKGLDEIKQAHVWLKEAGLPIDYRGFIEGNEIGQDVAHVVVTEGYTGNVALKTAEGTARQIAEYLRIAMSRSPVYQFGGLLARGAFRELKAKIDPRHANGAVFLGLNGMVIKSHGGTDALGYSAAIDIGYEMAGQGLVERLNRELDAFHGKVGVATPPTEDTAAADG